MVNVLVILDGASEPLGTAPTSLEQAVTPALDALAAVGALSRVRTVAPWLPAGSESAIPALLGWVPPAPVDRGAVEAAAHGLPVAPGERAWRIDVRDTDGARADRATVRAVAAALAAQLPRHAVHAPAGHRLLVVGPAPLPAVATAATLPAGATAGAAPVRPGVGAPPLPAGATVQLWPEGLVPARVLDGSTTMVAARGAAAGLARLMGAAVVVPPGATGRPRTDLAGKARAACDAIASGAARVVVHLGAPDEAAHECDVVAKIAAIEAADALLIGPLAEAVRAAGGTLRVCPDHGCDPSSGRHDAAPVPCVEWGGAAPAPVLSEGSAVQTASARRLTERAVAGLQAVEPTSGAVGAVA